MVREKRKFTSRKYLVIVSVAVVAIGISSVLVIRHSSKQSATTIPSTGSTSQAPSGSGNSASQPDKNASNLTTSGPGPTKPFGNFVSNHSPGNGLPTQEKSTCNTTPGASCYIQFTMGSLTKKLDAQTADSSGAVYWTWDVKDAGFLEGSWQITAVATLNGQISATQDQIPLKVQP
jgi:hypothetical protein